MTTTEQRKLPPMTALEFAIEKTFRHFFFGLKLAVMWAILIVPLLVATYFVAFRQGMPTLETLTTAAKAVLGLLAFVVLIATFSAAVNWHRRILLDETPRRFGWVRLDGVVWKYLLGFVVVVIATGILSGIAMVIVKLGMPAMEPKMGGAAKPVGWLLVTLIGLSALFTWYRLASWLPAIAVGDRDYSLKTAWRTTRSNRIAFLGFTFWLLFSCAVAGAACAGLFFAQKAMPNPWAMGVAFTVMGLLGWLALFMLMTVSTSLYYFFTGRGTVEE